MKHIIYNTLYIAFCLLFTAFSFLPFLLSAQNNLPEEPVKNEIELLQDGVENNLIEIKKLKKLKVSGYVQAQFEVGQEFASTKVGKTTIYDNRRGDGKSGNFFRFGIRRGRIKFAWEESFGLAVFQLDITEKGIALKDAYFKVSESWLKIASLTVGVFDRPFGDEISYSSSRRESPERTILFQKLFPDERDLGAMVTLAATKGSVIDGLKLDMGAFCGNGITLPDNGKMDLIGHLKYDKKWSNYTFGAGASIYYGTVRNHDSVLYTVQKNADGLFAWKADKNEQFNKKNIRSYYGFDTQFAAQSSWGISNIRTEILWGTQPSQKEDFTSPKTGVLQYEKEFNHIRNFWGAHLYFAQDIYRTPLTLVLKYAYMNPNTKIDKKQITNKTDLSYHYTGFGLLVRCNVYLRLMCFYELPFNQKNNGFKAPNGNAKPDAGFNYVKDYTKHVKEGVFTCRLQFKF
jgi:hypothetical protein